MATGTKPSRRSAEALALLESPQIAAMFEKVRLATLPEPPLQPQPTEQPKTSLSAIFGIGLLCTLAWWGCGGLRSPALRSTIAGGGSGAHAVVGETCLYNGDFYPNAAIEPLKQLDVVKASPDVGPHSVVATRGFGFAVLANLFSFLDSHLAPAACNLVLIWLCAWMVARATDALFRDRAKSLLASVCFSLSIVATSTVGQIGPLLLGLSLCFLWTLLLLQRDADDAPFTARGALGMCAVLGLWSLVEVGSLAGLVILAAYAIKRRKPGQFVLACFVWSACPLAQALVLRHLGLIAGTNPGVAQIGEALAIHQAHLVTEPGRHLGFLAIQFVNLLVNSDPISVAVCLVGLVFLPHKSRGLLWICYLAPILVQLILLPTTTDRGVATAGNTIVMFALVAHYGVAAARRLQSKVGGQSLAVAMCALAALSAAWGYSGRFGWDYPGDAFQTGVLNQASAVWPTKLLRLTSMPNEVPSIVGGKTPGTRFCGLAQNWGLQPILPVERVEPYRDEWSGQVRLERAMAIQAPAVIALLVAAAALLPLWRGVGVVTMICSMVVGAALTGSARGFDAGSHLSFDRRIVINEEEKLVGVVRLSEAFQTKLREISGRETQVEFFIRMQSDQPSVENPAEFQVLEWSATRARFEIPAREFLDSVQARGGRVEFAIAAVAGSKGLQLHSWQATRSGDERVAQRMHEDGTRETLDRFPSFEIRVLRPNRKSSFNRLLERFDSAPVASYQLVGY